MFPPLHSWFRQIYLQEFNIFFSLQLAVSSVYDGLTVILLNILIAQMSTTYTQAKKVARLEYDVDRILQLTRMERFPFLVSVQ